MNALPSLGEGPPLVLFGHSMGAAVAFETALLLEAASVPVSALVVSGRAAPSGGGTGNVRLLDDDGILAELRALNGTETTLLDDPELVRLMLPALRADYTATETYTRPVTARVSCPLTSLVGTADPRVPLGAARGWSVHTSGPFGLQTFPGGHFYLNGWPPPVLSALTSLALATPHAR